jgi:outer membrane biosynthesis protein TonB
MGSRKFNLKQILTPGDLIAAVVIIIGLLIAIFLSELAIRLIGLSIAILGGVALFMLISQRLSEIVDTRFKPSSPPPDFKITVKQDDSARRQVIEDFETSFPAEEEGEPEEEKKPELFEPSIKGDEGFRIIASKNKYRQKPAEKPETEEKSAPAEEKTPAEPEPKPKSKPGEQKQRSEPKEKTEKQTSRPAVSFDDTRDDVVEKDIEDIEKRLSI